MNFCAMAGNFCVLRWGAFAGSEGFCGVLKSAVRALRANSSVLLGYRKGFTSDVPEFALADFWLIC
jgi:hypothetical protein